MKRGQPKTDPPSAMTEQQTASSRPNRLSRSYRASQPTPITAQTDPPVSQQSAFKTPTRISRPRSGVFRSVSPHNESDVQQDIIWDATSPSPNRLGKRGRRQRAHVVDIAEIVERIAPKHGRPETAESTLQQWIGDNATISCTPDVQVSKPKKSPRLNDVNDLLKLAKQFDFMFHQDEEEDVQPSDLLFQRVFTRDADPAAAAQKAVWADVQMEDDLDFLFDGPTQQVNGALSQPRSSTCSSSAADVKETLANDGLKDDWEDDDLLNDSLLLEMTQNPHRFTSPKCCSTQKPCGWEEPARTSGDQSSVGRLQTTSDIWQNRSPPSCIVGSGWTLPVKSEPRESACQSSSAEANTAPESNQNLSPGSETGSSSKGAGDDPPPFLSDPVWDDPSNDHLLCELCEDLENQIQKEELTSTEWTDGQQRAPLQPANRNLCPPTSSSLVGGFLSKVPAAVGGENGPRPASGGTSQCGQFTFKKLVNGVPVKGGAAGVASEHPSVFSRSVWTPAPCSAAQIQQKKQQAMERRQQRLQLVQNRGPPT